MARQELDFTVNFDSPETRRQVMARIGAMRGQYEVSVKPRRSTRSTRANAYYHAAVVAPFFQFLKEQEPDITHPEQAHIELKRQILGTKRIRAGKALVCAVRGTRKMSVSDFYDYVERCRVFLRTMVGIETCDPGEFGVEPPAQTLNGAAAD